MGQEIERRFLVAASGWRIAAEAPRRLAQAYLAITPAAAIRVRIKEETAAWLTIKSSNTGMTRAEFEYPIPVSDAQKLLGLRIGELIEKERFAVLWRGSRWEVDVFGGALAPLMIAEIELTHEQESFDPPDWLGAEITDDGRYANASLAIHGLPSDFAGGGRT